MNSFLDHLRDHGLPGPSRMHYGLPEEGPWVAEIDFQVGKVHVLVDGSVHHRRWVQEIDQAKRETLKNEGYAILEYNADQPEEGLRKLRELL